MPILYHFTCADVNVKSGKYCELLFIFSVQNAQLFLREKLSAYFYLYPFDFPLFFVCLCILFGCFIISIHIKKTPG